MLLPRLERVRLGHFWALSLSALGWQSLFASQIVQLLFVHNTIFVYILLHLKHFSFWLCPFRESGPLFLLSDHRFNFLHYPERFERQAIGTFKARSLRLSTLVKRCNDPPRPTDFGQSTQISQRATSSRRKQNKAPSPLSTIKNFDNTHTAAWIATRDVTQYFFSCVKIAAQIHCKFPHNSPQKFLNFPPRLFTALIVPTEK